MENRRAFILISNDDGYRAKGIRSLADMLAPLADVLVCAPEGPRSGYACAFSAETPLRLKLRHRSQGVEVWSCNGTPVDCVKLALSQLCPDRRPDLIVGGINHGDNSSVNTHYSGTMGVTMEGCMKYIPSVAFSLCSYDEDADFSPMTALVRAITQRLLSEGLPQGVCLNVNFPDGGRYNGVRVCRMAFGRWCQEVEKCRHPRGYDYYWMVGHYHNDEPDAADTDRWALAHGYVAITPTRLDVTAHEALQSLKPFESLE